MMKKKKKKKKKKRKTRAALHECYASHRIKKGKLATRYINAMLRTALTMLRTALTMLRTALISHDD